MADLVAVGNRTSCLVTKLRVFVIAKVGLQPVRLVLGAPAGQNRINGALIGAVVARAADALIEALDTEQETANACLDVILPGVLFLIGTEQAAGVAVGQIVRIIGAVTETQGARPVFRKSILKESIEAGDGELIAVILGLRWCFV